MIKRLCLAVAGIVLYIIPIIFVLSISTEITTKGILVVCTIIPFIQALIALVILLFYCLIGVMMQLVVWVVIGETILDESTWAWNRGMELYPHEIIKTLIRSRGNK